MWVTALTANHDEHRYAVAAALLSPCFLRSAKIPDECFRRICSEAGTQFPWLAQSAEAYEHAKSRNALAQSVQLSEKMLSMPGLKRSRTTMLLGRVLWETAMRNFSLTSQMKVGSVCHSVMPQGIFYVISLAVHWLTTVSHTEPRWQRMRH